MPATSSGTDWTGIIGALGALGFEGYAASQGQPVSTTLGPGGAAFIQSGPAATQTSIFLIVLALGLLAVLAYIFLK